MITFEEITNIEYEAIEKVDDRIYFITDKNQIWYNGIRYSQNIFFDGSKIQNTNFVGFKQQLDSQNNRTNITISEASQNNIGGVKITEEITNETDNTKVPTVNALKQFVSQNDSNTINGISGQIEIQAGNGIGISQSTNKIVIQANNSNSKYLQIEIDGNNIQQENYSVTFDYNNNSITIQHNFGGIAFGYVFDQLGNQIDIPINYIDDNNVLLKYELETLESIKKIALFSIGSTNNNIKQKTVLVTGKKPSIVKQFEHTQYGYVGVLNTQNKDLTFKGYECEGIEKMEFWYVGNSEGIAIIYINQIAYELEVSTVPNKKTIYFDQKLTGKINIERDQENTTNDTLADDLYIIDWVLYTQQYSNIYASDIPYVIYKQTNQLKINSFNGYNQVVKNISGDIYFNSYDILNLPQDKTIKIRFEIQNNCNVFINDHHIQNLNVFYAMFININGEIKQIGNVIQVE